MWLPPSSEEKTRLHLKPRWKGEGCVDWPQSLSLGELHGQRSSSAFQGAQPFFAKRRHCSHCIPCRDCVSPERACVIHPPEESPFLFFTKGTTQLVVALPKVIIAVTRPSKISFQSTPIYIISFENYNNSVT